MRTIAPASEVARGSLVGSDLPRENAGQRGSLRIAYIVPEFPGQTHTWIWREIAWMLRWGVEVTIFSTRPPRPEEEARHAFAAAARERTIYLWPRSVSRAAGDIAWAVWRHPVGLIKCIALSFVLPTEPSPNWRRLLPLIFPACALARELQARGIDRLHSHSCGNSAVLCMMARRLTGIQFSLTLNANVEWWGGAMAEKIGESDFTIAITERLVAQLRRDFPQLRAEQVQLGRIGVDPEQWFPQAAASTTICPGRLVSVGRLHPSKAHDVTLRALALLRHRHPKASLRIVGAGPDRERLDALVEELGLREAVHLLGSKSEAEIQSEMRRSDVFVLASHAEPLGVVYMEAMAMGLPTVGTAAGGVAEIITGGIDGLLVPPGDPEELAATLGRLLDDSELRQRLSQAGRKAIVERFDSRFGARGLYRRIFGDDPEADRGPC